MKINLKNDEYIPLISQSMGDGYLLELIVPRKGKVDSFFIRMRRDGLCELNTLNRESFQKAEDRRGYMDEIIYCLTDEMEMTRKREMGEAKHRGEEIE